MRHDPLHVIFGPSRGDSSPPWARKQTYINTCRRGSLPKARGWRHHIWRTTSKPNLEI